MNSVNKIGSLKTKKNKNSDDHPWSYSKFSENLLNNYVPPRLTDYFNHIEDLSLFNACRTGRTCLRDILRENGNE